MHTAFSSNFASDAFAFRFRLNMFGLPRENWAHQHPEKDFLLDFEIKNGRISWRRKLDLLVFISQHGLYKLRLKLHHPNTLEIISVHLVVPSFQPVRKILILSHIDFPVDCIQMRFSSPGYARR